MLCELQSELPSEEKQVSLSQFIDSLGLDDKILHFDRTEEDFTDNWNALYCIHFIDKI